MNEPNWSKSNNRKCVKLSYLFVFENFLLKYSWFISLCLFLLNRKLIQLYICMCYFGSFTGCSMEKNSPANAGDKTQETWVRSLGQEYLWEEERATCSRIPAGIIPWTEEPGGPQSLGWQRVWHDSKHMHMHSFLCSFPFWFIKSQLWFFEFWIVQL